MQPRIGITTYGAAATGRYNLPAEYVHAVTRAGGIPLLLPHAPADPSAVMGCVDGLILSGGGDIAASCYGGAANDFNYLIDAERDSNELALAKAALGKDLPVLAICRGLQIINILHGGTLHEHLPDVVGEDVLHRAPPREPVAHTITIEPDSRLANVLGTSDCAPMSWHHQAINHLGEGLEVVGRAPDGVIEAVDLPAQSWFIGVQWHPEITAAEDAQQQQLFDALVSAAKG